MIHTRESVLEALRSAKGASLGRKIDTLGRAAREAFCKAPARGEEFSIALLADRPIYEAELDAVVDALNAAGAPATKATVPCPRCAGGTPCEVCGGKGRLPARGGPLRGEGVCSDFCIKTRGYGMQLYCTLAAGHEGDHVGHSGAGNALGTWPQAAPARERDWRAPPPFASCELTSGGTWHCAYYREDVPVQWRGVRGEGATQADAYADFCARIRRGYAGPGKGVARCAHDGGDLVSTKGIVCVLCGATGMRLSDDAAPAAPWTAESVKDALCADLAGRAVSGDAVHEAVGRLWGRDGFGAWAGAGYSEHVCFIGNTPFYLTRFEAVAVHLNAKAAQPVYDHARAIEPKLHTRYPERAFAHPAPEPRPLVVGDAVRVINPASALAGRTGIVDAVKANGYTAVLLDGGAAPGVYQARELELVARSAQRAPEPRAPCATCSGPIEADRGPYAVECADCHAHIADRTNGRWKPPYRGSKPDPYVAARIDRLKKAGDLGSSVLATVEAATAACRDRLAVVRHGAAQARETVAHYEAMEREIVAALAECGAKDGAS